MKPFFTIIHSIFWHFWLLPLSLCLVSILIISFIGIAYADVVLMGVFALYIVLEIFKSKHGKQK